MSAFRSVLLLTVLALGPGCKDRAAAADRPGDKPEAQVPASALASASGVVAEASTAAKPARRVDRVVLLTIDALRGDQPWTGYELAKTPVLSRVAQEGIVYTRNYAIANTTGPAISGLLAVRFPTELDRDNCPLAGFTIGEGLGPVLLAAGVWTGAAHGHAYFGASTAPKDGFKDWRTVENVAGRFATQGAVTGPEVTELTLALLEAAPAGKPAFIWAHYLEPHDSYVFHKDFPPSGHPRRGVYDGEVAFADNEVGKVIAAIDASSYKDRTAIIVSADHGEAFGEHERYRHGFTVFEEEVWVPLMMRIPGHKPQRIDTPRSVMDIPRTVAALLGVDPPARWRGASLLEDLGKEAPEERPVIVDVPELMNLPAQQAVLLGKYKVVRFGPKWSVYDLEADPKEKSPLPRKQVGALIEKAEQALGTLETVPHQACKRQAFKD
jgi:arylsulfatase A-like enzyme